MTLLILNGCSETPPGNGVPATAASGASDPASTNKSFAENAPAISTASAPMLFTNPSTQRRFEIVYGELLTVFDEPTPGTPIRIFKTNGLRIEGDLIRFSVDGIVIVTQDGPVIIPQDEMTLATQETLYGDVFSAVLAERLVKLETAGTKSATLNDLHFDAASATPSETRRITADRITTRQGPGLYYREHEGTELFRGQNVGVLHETNNWICVAASPDSVVAAGWIPKFSSFMLNPEDKAAVKREIDGLYESGFLININPARNEALVDRYEWRISDKASVEGKSQLLAIYCGQQKGSRLYWVDIKDALSGKRLAGYSVSKGFKVY